MYHKTEEKLEKIAKRHQGVFTLNDANEIGISRATVNRLHKSGIISNIYRGIYQLNDEFNTSGSSPEYLAIKSRVPSAVLCCISALYHHELTTEIPSSVHIAINRNKSIPKIDYLPLEIYRMQEATFSHGVQTCVVSGVKMKIFSPEKTIADCFKYRNRIGVDLAIEGLKRYLERPDANISKILTMADITRVSTIIEPYLEALV
jgi:predicted transcriptional regulator of viral defense system